MLASQPAHQPRLALKRRKGGNRRPYLERGHDEALEVSRGFQKPFALQSRLKIANQRNGRETKITDQLKVSI